MIQNACLSCGNAHEECTCTEGPAREWRRARTRARRDALVFAAADAAKKYPELAEHMLRVQQQTDEINKRRGRV